MENKDLELLSDDSLSDVSGGTHKKPGSQLVKIQCKCGTINIVDVSRSKFKCTECNSIHRIDG